MTGYVIKKNNKYMKNTDRKLFVDNLDEALVFTSPACAIFIKNSLEENVEGQVIEVDIVIKEQKPYINL